MKVNLIWYGGVRRSLNIQALLMTNPHLRISSLPWRASSHQRRLIFLVEATSTPSYWFAYPDLKSPAESCATSKNPAWSWKPLPRLTFSTKSSRMNGSSLGSLPCLSSIATDYTTIHWVPIPHCFLAYEFSFLLNAFPSYLNSKLSNSKNHVLDFCIPIWFWK